LVPLTKLCDLPQAVLDTPNEVIPVGLRRPQGIFVLLPDLSNTLREFCLEARPCVLVLSVVPVLKQPEGFLGAELRNSGEITDAKAIQNLSTSQFAYATAQRTLDSFGRRYSSHSHRRELEEC